MRRLSLTFASVALALVAVLAAGVLAPRAHAAEPDAAPSVLAPRDAPAPCSGNATTDAAVTSCGVHLAAATTTLTWVNDAAPIEAVLATPRLAFHGTPPRADARPLDYVTVWQRDATGAWRSWSSKGDGPFATLRTFEPGGTYTLAATADLDLSLAPLRASVFARTRVISMYGHPGVPTMGALGTYPTAEAAATAVDDLVRQYQALDTAAGRDTRVVGALHLIVSVAQADPGWDGTYLGRMTLAEIRPWVEVTRAHGQLLFLDVQVGWADPVTEVQRLEPLLREAHVHVALDPEFATRAKGWAPGEAIGFLTAAEVNAVQRYLLDLSVRAATTSKVLVLHQFRTDMLSEPDRIERVEGVDVAIDMDGWGPPGQKLDGYNAFALAPYAEYAAFKLFYHWDVPLLTPAQVMALRHAPDYLIYQ